MFKKKTIRRALTFLERLIFGFLVAVFLVVASPMLPFTNIPRTYIVTTGSMEPTISTGSIIVSKPVEKSALKKGTIVAFKSPKDPKNIILHRIYSVKTEDPLVFETKGDNNNAPDNWEIPEESVVGLYVFSIPLLGHPAAFMRKPLGFALMIGLPALLIIIMQILNIKKGIEEEVEKRLTKKMKDKEKEETKGQGMNVFIGILFGLIPLTLVITSSVIQALFQDTVTVSGITLSVKDFVPPNKPTNLHWNNPDVSCGGVTNSYTITADWDDAVDVGGSGINHYEYNITYPKLGGDTGNWTTTVIPSQYSGVFNQDNGVHTYKVRAYDNDGNVSEWSDTCTIYYDNQSPIVSIGRGNNVGTPENYTGNTNIPLINAPLNIGPAHGNSYSGMIDVYATIEDPHLSGWHFRIIKDGLTTDTHTCGATLSDPGNQGYNKCGYLYTMTGVGEKHNEIITSLDTTKLSGNGTYWLILGAIDSLNQRTAGPITAPNYWHRDPRIKITVTNVPPTPLLISPGNNTTLNSTLLVQKWQEVTDGTVGEIYYDYQSFSDLSMFHPRWSGTFSNSIHGDGTIIAKHAEGAPDGDVYWRVRSRNGIGSSAWSELWHFTIDNSRPNSSSDVTIPPSSNIVLNEYLPNPVGLDDSIKPNGQWVELYNRTDFPVDVLGWSIDDGESTHNLVITGVKTNTGDTIINPHGFLVVYRDGDPNFDVLASKHVRLLNSASTLLDEYIYTSPLFVLEGKSIGRYPDGGDTWYDPIPSPGKPNVLETDVIFQDQDLNGGDEKGIILGLSYDLDKHTVQFSISPIDLYIKLQWELTYETDNGEEGVVGEKDIAGMDTYEKNDIYIGTCSSGGTCVPHTGANTIHLTVTLTDGDGKETLLEKSL